MAPEQADGRPDAIGPATDVFGLGAILYELLTGVPPYQGKTIKEVIEQAKQGRIRPPRQLQPRVPRGLERMCLKSLATDPEQRYATAAGLAADLRRYRRWSHKIFASAASFTLLLLAGLGTWLLAGRPGWPTPIPEQQASIPDSTGRSGGQPKSSQAELAAGARDILKTRCYRCHGENGAIEGGFNYILDREQLVTRRKIVPGNPGASRLLQRIKSGEMPPEEAPPPLTDADVATLEGWIREGAPASKPPEKRPFISPDAVLQLIRNDLEKASPKERECYRYFTITHLYNAGLPEDGLQTYRFALSKLVNSLSWQREIVRPVAIDPPQRTVFRIDLSDYLWPEDVWWRILAAYPYPVVPPGDNAKFCSEATKCPLPHVRADWFVFAASRPPLYHQVLQLPDTAGELEARLRVDVKVNRQQRKRVARAGFNGSGVAVSNNRLIERHAFNDGAYWRSFDFRKPDKNGKDRRNLFQYPLGPGPAARAFRHDGGEIIFSLPNGLQGYLLVDASDRRVDRGPADLVRDPRQKEGAVLNGISCMSCHVRGVIDKTDMIRDHVWNERLTLDDEVVREVQDLYPRPEKFKQLLQADAERFARAVREATGAPPGGTDPIVALAARYEWELDRDLAAAEAGLGGDDFVKRLDRSKELGPLVGVIRNEGGTVQRQVWEDHFADLVRELKLGEFRPVTGTPPPPATITNSIGMTLKRIPAGTFQMGSPGQEGKVEHPHEVEITREFFVGVFEVTQEEYEKVMGKNPSSFKGPKRPVERVSWKDAVEFCKKLSERPDEQAHRRVYRLPTEAEWEYVARAGMKTAYFFGDDDEKLGEHAWFAGSSEDRTHDVGTRKPNPWGLHDVYGNVREWCADYYDGDYYLSNQRRDPPGPSESGSPLRVLRGGSYDDKPHACRSAARRSSFDTSAYAEIGFRVVLLTEEKKP
jgi:formylglycine-generating enzyme required for sulfatase activity